MDAGVKDGSEKYHKQIVRMLLVFRSITHLFIHIRRTSGVHNGYGEYMLQFSNIGIECTLRPTPSSLNCLAASLAKDFWR
jgi:hypothetical protein